MAKRWPHHGPTQRPRDYLGPVLTSIPHGMALVPPQFNYKGERHARRHGAMRTPRPQASGLEGLKGNKEP